MQTIRFLFFPNTLTFVFLPVFLLPVLPHYEETSFFHEEVMQVSLGMTLGSMLLL